MDSGVDYGWRLRHRTFKEKVRLLVVVLNTQCDWRLLSSLGRYDVLLQQNELCFGHYKIMRSMGLNWNAEGFRQCFKKKWIRRKLLKLRKFCNSKVGNF